MKNSAIIRKYIELVLESNAHVPTQLINPENAEENHEESELDTDEEDDNEKDSVEEFASVAGAMGGSGLGGYSAPVGANKKDSGS